MDPFLKKLARHLAKEYGDDLSTVAVVLPSKRGKTFFKSFLGKELNKPTWSPALFAIDEFTEELSGLGKAEPLNLLFDLYEVHIELTNDKDDFKEFCSWGSVMLQDLNEIDSYLVDAGELFGYLSEAKAIQLWNPGETSLTEFQQKYLAFWRSLPAYYDAFSKKLLEKRCGYAGLIFRKAAERAPEQIELKKWRKVIFAGFNALTPAEEKIIRYLKESGKCETIWDADSYYLDDRHQEAGKFLRSAFAKGLRTSNDTEWVSDDLCTGSKKIKVISATQNTAQPRIAGQLLTEILKTAEHSETGVVLADEALLLPTLENLPADVKAVNITMGYPFKTSPVYHFILSVLELHMKAAELIKLKIRTEPFFYLRNVTELVSNPITALVAGNETYQHLRKLINDFSKANRMFIRPEELQKIKATSALFKFTNSPSELLQIVASSLEIAITTVNEKKTINGEFVLAGYKLVLRVKDFVEKNGIDQNGLIYLFQTISSAHTIPFFGEPVKGLQLMGVLETRTLDFKNVVLLSGNEGILPSGSKSNSFIPIEIKKLFGLPTYADRDAVFAYHFYRLLQRAENIWIVYSSSSTESGPGEKSRYVSQLQYELPKKNPNATITEVSLSNPPSQELISPVLITKTPEILQAIERKLTTGVSPSAFNLYRDCSYKFYLRYVAGIKEPADNPDGIDAATFGQLVHKVLEEFYAPFKGKALTSSEVTLMLKDVEGAAKKVFLTKVQEQDLFQGKNLLSFKVAIRFLKNFLEQEKKFLAEHGAILIEGLEESLSRKLEVDGRTITVSGFADRIDKVSDAIRIIDYKTGTVKPGETSLEQTADVLTLNGKGKSLQLLLYAWLLNEDERFKDRLKRSGIFALRQSSAGLNSVKVAGGDILDTERIGEIETTIKEMVREMLNPETALVQTKETRSCTYCGYAGICGR